MGNSSYTSYCELFYKENHRIDTQQSGKCIIICIFPIVSRVTKTILPSRCFGRNHHLGFSANIRCLAAIRYIVRWDKKGNNTALSALNIYWRVGVDELDFRIVELLPDNTNAG